MDRRKEKRGMRKQQNERRLGKMGKDKGKEGR
jgi:hypothetical protein